MFTDHTHPITDSGQEAVAAIEEVGDAWANLMRSFGQLSRSLDVLTEASEPGNQAVA